MTLAMACIYIAGVISGVILVIIALVGWIHKAALKIEEKKRGESIGTYSGAASVENNSADRYQRRRRSFATPT